MTSASHAANLFWDGTDTGANANGGNGTWDTTTANWDTAATGGANAIWNNATPDSATFGGSAGTVTLGANITTGGATAITFSTAGYTIAQDAGNLYALTVGTGGVNLGGGSATINAKLTGANSWTANWGGNGGSSLTIGGSVANDSTGTITALLPSHLILAKTGGVAATAGNIILANNPMRMVGGDQSIGGTVTFQTSYNSRLHPRSNTFTTRGLVSANGNVGVIENSGLGAGGGGNSGPDDRVTGTGTIKIVTQAGDNWSYGALIRDGDGANSGTLAIVKDGDGTQTLAGSQYLGYTGGTTINGGTLKYDLAGLGGAPQNLRSNTINANGILELSNTNAAIDNGTGLLNGTFSGSGTINKTGAGYVDFWGGNSGSNLSAFTGTINVTGGTLASNGAVWNAASSVTLNVATTFDVRSGSVIIDKLTGNGTITTSFNGGNLLTVGAAGGSSTFGGVIQNGTATLPLTKVGGGTFILTGANTYTGTTNISGGTLQVGNGGTTGSLSTSSAITNNATLAFNRSDTVTQGTHFNSVIGGSGSVLQAGTGTLVLNGVNTYGGSTTVSRGTLELNNASAASGSTIMLNDANTGANNVTLQLGTAASSYTNPITVSNNGTGTTTIRSNFTGGHSFLNGAITLNKPTTIYAATGGNIFAADGGGISGNVGTLTIDGAGGGSRVQFVNANTFTGDVVIAANGILQIGGGNAIPNASNVTVDGNLRNQSGTSETIGGLSGTGTVTPTNGGGFNLTVGSGDASATFTGSIGTGFSTFTLTKIGDGVQTLSGSNTYTGITNINGGTLLVDGTHTGGALYTVAPNATLGGIGSITAPVTVSSGGKLAPGSTVAGVLDVGNLLLSSGSIFEVHLDGPALYDQVDVTGTVNLAGSFLDLVLGYTPTIGSTYTLIVNDSGDAVGGEFSGLAEGTQFSVGGRLWQISYIGGTGNDVVLTAAPEPSTFLFGLAGVFALALFAWRECRRSIAVSATVPAKK